MSLSDVTNTVNNKCAVKGINKKIRLRDGSFKVYKYDGARKQIDLVFRDESEKIVFDSKISNLKQRHGLRTTKDVFNLLISENEERHISQLQSSENHDALPEKPDHGQFVCENNALLKLINLTAAHSGECKSALQINDITYHGHVADAKLQCDNGHIIHWTSSSKLGTHYTVNYRMMLGYLCSGITPIQYERFSNFSDIGILTQYFLSTVIITFAAAIDLLARQSVIRAIEEEKRKSKTEPGITIMTDARHACRKNSFHTDHVALGNKTHKIVNIQTVTKKEERSSQKHESVGCSRMYEDFVRDNVKVNVHVHDRNTSINKTVKSVSGVKNCNERWHAARPITKGLKKIGSGAKKQLGKSWHPQITDKGALVRNHMYWAMENCDNDPNTLRQHIDSCVTHFQNNHTSCHADSHCRKSDYVPNFDVITDQPAVDLLSKFLKSLTLYKSAEDYVLSLDTYYVESYNNTCLIYLDKRIHYKERMYKTRSQLTVLDWNEHVDRAFTSVYHRMSAKHNRRNHGKKKYKKKTYAFVEELWELIVSVAGSAQEASGANSEYIDNDDDDDDDNEDDDNEDDDDDDDDGSD